MVQSFADGRLGFGTIYKATNFKYFGFHKTKFYENKITGEITHEVLMNNARHIGIVRMNRQLCEGILKLFVVKIYLSAEKNSFQTQRKRLSGIQYRKRISYRIEDDFNVIRNWILNNQTDEEIKSYMKLALGNEYILQRAGRKNRQHKIDELYSLFQT